MLTLYFHPLSSFCQKVLIGLYELDVPFAKRSIDLGDEADRAALRRLWPMVKFPVLHDEARGVALPESSVILEYLRPARGRTAAHPERSDRGGRLRDRFYDLHVDTPVGKIVTDKLRPEGKHDPHGVAEARAQLETAYGIADEWLRAGSWAAGDSFTMADCAAAPALFFADKVVPFDGRWPHPARYCARLTERRRSGRAFDEAKPYPRDVSRAEARVAAEATPDRVKRWALVLPPLFWSRSSPRRAGRVRLEQGHDRDLRDRGGGGGGTASRRRRGPTASSGRGPSPAGCPPTRKTVRPRDGRTATPPFPPEGQAEDVSSSDHRDREGRRPRANCTGDAFVAAVAKGGVITFDCGPDPTTITLTFDREGLQRQGDEARHRRRQP